MFKHCTSFQFLISSEYQKHTVVVMLCLLAFNVFILGHPWISMNLFFPPLHSFFAGTRPGAGLCHECRDQETEGNAAANAAPGTVPASPARAPAAAVPQSQPPAAASRHFLERWRANRPWLVYSAEEKKLCFAVSAVLRAKGKQRGNTSVAGSSTMKCFMKILSATKTVWLLMEKY